MANVLTVVYMALLWIVTQTAGMLFIRLLFPQASARAQEALIRRPLRSFLLGAFFWTVSLVLLIVLLRTKASGLQMLGWLAAGPAFAASLLGGAGFCSLAADRLEEASPGASLLKRLLLSGLTISLAGLIPLIGWFLVTPLCGLLCVGAGLQAFLTRGLRPAGECAAVDRTVWNPAPSPGEPAQG